MSSGRSPVRVRSAPQMSKNLIIFFVFVAYILVGSFFAFQDVLSPDQFDPAYLQWLQKTPPDERTLDIVLWPVVFLPSIIRTGHL